MKHFIGEINTYIGESEISTMVKFKTEGDPFDYLDSIASKFWGDENQYEFDVGMYNFGDRVAGVGRWQEVDADTYNKVSIIVEIRND